MNTHPVARLWALKVLTVIKLYDTSQLTNIKKTKKILTLQSNTRRNKGFLNKAAVVASAQSRSPNYKLG